MIDLRRRSQSARSFRARDVLVYLVDRSGDKWLDHDMNSCTESPCRDKYWSLCTEIDVWLLRERNDYGLFAKET